MAHSLTRRAFHGTFIHSVTLTRLEYIDDGLIGVNCAGLIAFLDKGVSATAVPDKLKQHGWDGVEVTYLPRGEFLIPGFIDTHTHAPQYINLSYGDQFELLDWLTNVTFPAEEKFADAHYAARTYNGVVQKVLNAGTTTCCYYGTLHMTTKILAAICHQKGQRAFVGKCNMDRNSAPTYQEESAAKSLADTEEYVDFVRTRCVSPTCACTSEGTAMSGHPAPTSPGSKYTSDLVQPIITPRFAISCSDELLSGLGAMVKADLSLPIQTHLAENPSEIQFTQTLFPMTDSYTGVYDHFGLLRDNTVLAHCVHLDEREMDLIKAREAGISHCPTSNFNLRSGASRVTTMLDRGIKVSLGTDVSGGFSLGILSAIRQASIASKTHVYNARDAPNFSPVDSPDLTASIIAGESVNYPPGYFSSRHLGIETLFYLATMGGAQVCCLEDRVGNFVVGKEFDALLIQTGQRDPAVVDKSEALQKVASEEERALEHILDDRFPRESKGFCPSLMVEPEDSIEKVFEKFLFSGDDRNIGTVFVRGRVVGGARPIAQSSA